MEKEKNINIKEAQEVLEVFSSLDENTKELALATITGMRLVADSEKARKKADEKEVIA